MKSFTLGAAGCLAMTVLVIGVAWAGNIFTVDQNGAVRLVVTDTGNVGIGNPAPDPGSRLVVRSSGTGTTTSALDVQASDGTSRLFVRDDGYTGVGTNTPSTLLDVSGSAGDVRINETGAHIQFTRGANNYFHALTSGGQFFFTVNGNTDTSAAMVINSSGNIGIGTTNQFGTGAKVVGIANATTVPATNPTGGGALYAEAGALKWRGSSGTVTTIAPAEPHCPDCGRDFVVEWTNERYGHLMVCMWCFTENFANAKGVFKKEARQ